MTDGEKFTFLDFEASSLGGYPIEIGWARLPGIFTNPEEAIVSDSFLIRPADHWLADPDLLWDPAAQALHGISMEQLVAEGLSHKEVCQRLQDQLHHDTVFVSSVSLDYHWMGLLYDFDPFFFAIEHWSVLFEYFWQDPNCDAMVAARKAQQDMPKPHRARLDAVWMALIFAAAWQHDGRHLEGI